MQIDFIRKTDTNVNKVLFSFFSFQKKPPKKKVPKIDLTRGTPKIKSGNFPLSFIDLQLYFMKYKIIK